MQTKFPGKGWVLATQAAHTSSNGIKEQLIMITIQQVTKITTYIE